MLEVDIGAAILLVEQMLTGGLPSDAQRLEMTPASRSGGDAEPVCEESGNLWPPSAVFGVFGYEKSPQTAYRLASGDWLVVGPVRYGPVSAIYQGIFAPEGRNLEALHRKGHCRRQLSALRGHQGPAWNREFAWWVSG